jgi:Uma2 family endonuclease
MQTLEEIRAALRRLTVEQRMTVELWLQQLDGIPGHVREARSAYAADDPTFMTLDEFFEFEKTAPFRHEFVNGVLFAMSGASLAHNRVIQNMAFAIRNHLERDPREHGPCAIYSSDVRLVIRRDVNEISYYPDVMVDCRPDTRDPHYVRDPKLIVEVLSPSTQITDFREKLQNYRLIDSVEEYVIAAQDERRVIVYPRAECWKPRVYGAIDAAVELRSIDLTMPMIELYDGVPYAIVQAAMR